MKLLYQIHNVGIYIDGGEDDWGKNVTENLKTQFDGFEIYKGCMEIEYQLIVKNISQLGQRKDKIVVPECSAYYSDGVFYSDYLEIAYKISDFKVEMWTNDNTWYAPYLLELLFVKQGITFVHGASVAVDGNKGKLLLAFGGIGKTCFVANAVKKESVTLLGDDLILVSKTGKLYSYPRPFCLYEYHKTLFPQFFENNKIKYVHIEKNMYFKRIVRKTKNLMKIRDNNVYSFVPVSPVRLFPKEKIQVEPVKLCDIYVLRRNSAKEKIDDNNMLNYEQVTNFAIDVIFHEWDIGSKLIMNKCAQEFSNFEDYLHERYAIMEKAFKNAENIYCLDIPEEMKADEVSVELNNIILKGVQ